MDGWGSNPKTPFAFDQEATDLNRAYLKLKSMMMPYNYSIAKESVDGLPMVRAMALEFPNEGTAYTKILNTNICGDQIYSLPQFIMAIKMRQEIQSVMESTYQMKNKSGLTYLQAKNIKVAVS